jgi:hypothetical protein
MEETEVESPLLFAHAAPCTGEYQVKNVAMEFADL